MEVVGYFNWRKTLLGGTTFEKVALEHHSSRLRIKGDKERYNERLLKELPLNEKEWKLSLSDLALKYPCPELLEELG